MAGLRVGVSWGRETDEARSYRGAAAAYENDALRVSLGFGRERREAVAYPVANWMLLVAYDLKGVKLIGAYGEDRNGKFNAAGGVKAKDFGESAELVQAAGLGQYARQGFKASNYYAGAAIRAGSGTLGVAYSRSSSNLGSFGFDAAAQNMVAALYSYPLSKRTQLYAYGGLGRGVAYVRSLEAHEIGAGLRHEF